MLKNLTELNARSARADFIIYDEEAQADEDAYNAAVNILAGSPLGIIIHISTTPFKIFNLFYFISAKPKKLVKKKFGV